MKNKELFNLAKTSFKRQKSSRLIVLSLTFAIVMITLAVWLIISFYGYMAKMLKSVPTNAFDVRLERHADLPDNQYDDLHAMLEGKECVESFGFSFLSFAGGAEENFVLGDPANGEKSFNNKKLTNKFGGNKDNLTYYDEDDYSSDKKVIGYITKMQFINLAKSNNKCWLSSAEDYFNKKGKKILLKGNSLSGDGKRQIMVSERFVQFNNLDINNIVGKKLSYSLNYATAEDDIYGNNAWLLDKDSDANNGEDNVFAKGAFDFSVQIFKDFEIVGVFSNDYLAYNNNFEFIVSDKSFDENDLPLAYKPVYTMKNSDYAGYSKQVADAGKVFPFMYMNRYSTEWESSFMGDSMVYVYNYATLEMKEFKGVYKYFWNNYEQAHNAAINNHDIRTTFRQESNIVSTYQTLETCAMFLLAFGVIIFVAVTINLYNLLAYNSMERSKVLLIYNAIGFTQTDVKKMYFFECLIGYLKAFLYSLLASVAFITIIVVAVNKVLKEFGYIFNLTLAVAFSPLAMLIVALLSAGVVGITFLLTKRNIKNAKLNDYEL